MTTDPTIREQSYCFFLQEAAELLQALEQDLYSLRADYSINKVHNLMRTTHTLKGAAASVGLETIKTVAHSLEDIFKVLCKPESLIDQDIEALLFEGCECLRIPITAELTGGQINEAEILDRMATVFVQLQEKLGDNFNQEAEIPSSLDLGFDITQSIFEVGVNQRLEEIETAIINADQEVIAATLRTQAEVFLGLAESLNLPGFGAIAQVTIAALNTAPAQVMTIAQTALSDFQAGQLAVLKGDRTQGGQPSLALQQLAGRVNHSIQDDAVNLIEPFIEVEGTGEIIPAGDEQNLTLSASFFLASSASSSPDEEDSLALSELEAGAVDSLLEVIWGESLSADSQSEPDDFVVEDTEQIPSVQPLQTHEIPSPSQANEAVTARTVRVKVEHLEQLNYLIGELLTNQNRQSLQNEQRQAATRLLLARLKQHQQRLGELQDWSDSLFAAAEQRQIRDWRIANESLKVPAGSHWHRKAQPIPHEQNRFDSLELDRYSESQILVQAILDDAVQLADASDSIDSLTTESHQTLEKQRRLLTSTRDALMEARMLPLGNVFERFPRVLQQLEAQHDKSVALELNGTEVLVDKVVVEKLYDPLLHLVRNAFSHGIEPLNLRQQQGKPKIGKIALKAYHQGKFLVIEVQDDGQGLDFAGIRQRAIAHQLVSPELASSLNESQLKSFLFEPGFSTASQVNDLSGRGIGLDVVQSQVQALQGSVMVYSEPNRGTMFRLQIPLSLTISKLLLCQAGDRSYAFLTEAIEQILIPEADQIRTWENGKVLRWGKGANERLVPIYHLTKVLEYYSLIPEVKASPSKHSFLLKGQVTPIMLIRCQDTLFGLEVDQLMGEQELVIRPLGAMITPPAFVYGSSILADGRLTLVLDGVALMQYVVDQTEPLTKSPSLATPQHKQLPSQTRRPALPALPASGFLAKHDIGSTTILIVDDSITLRQSLVLTLQKAGYQVLQAKDGHEAIAQLQQQKDIQLVICDIEMPRLNGFEFLKHRQQDQTLADIPVVILTSRSAEKHRLIAFELGATDYLTKPFLEQELLSVVIDVLDKNVSIVF